MSRMRDGSTNMTTTPGIGDLVRLYTGEINATQLMSNVVKGVKDNRELAERLCETYFYLEQSSSWAKGNRKGGHQLLLLALANNVYDFIEHRYALLELELMARKPCRRVPRARAAKA